MNKHRLIIGITGASGSVYAKVLLDKLDGLKDQIDECGIVMSANVKEVWKHELGQLPTKWPFRVYDRMDFNAPFASGSAKFNTMIICPCSMGTLGRIAGGISNDLITRSADVILKERRKLILVARETPLSLIHLNNMTTITQAGGIIVPASPSFYGLAIAAKTDSEIERTIIERVAATVVDRVLDIAGFKLDSYRWQGSRSQK